MARKCVFSTILAIMVPVVPQAAAQTITNESSAKVDDIIVVSKRIEKSHVRFSVDRRTRAVRCKPINASTDPVYADLKCEIVRRCASVEPYSRSNVRACLEKTRNKVAEEFVK